MRSEVRLRPVFTKIVYSQAWEDPAVDVAALRIGAQDDVFAIGASGDNALALLLEEPRSLTAVDFNLTQNCLLELKIAAILTLPWGEMLELLGARPSGRRERFYAKLRGLLSEEARGFWDRSPDLLRRGPIHVGRFEGMFRLFRWTVLPAVQSRAVVERMLACRTLDEQRRVYRDEWDGWRWRALFRLFFNKTVIGATGRDPAFFKYVKEKSVADVFLERTRHLFEEIPVRGNWFLEYILPGEYADERLLPPYLLEENHPRLRRLVDRVKIVNAALEEWLPTLPMGSFSKFYLSDIFEYMSEEAAERLLREIWRVGRDGGVLSYRNLLAPRARPAAMAAVLVPDEARARECNFQDRSFVYTRHQIETIRKPRVDEMPAVQAASKIAERVGPIVEVAASAAAKAIEELLEKPLARLAAEPPPRPAPAPGPAPPPKPPPAPAPAPPATPKPPVPKPAVKRKNVAKPPNAPTRSEEKRGDGDTA